MAFGFMKKIFSFGRKEVVEAVEDARDELAVPPAPTAEDVPALRTDDELFGDAAEPPKAEWESPVPDVPDPVFEPVFPLGAEAPSAEIRPDTAETETTPPVEPEQTDEAALARRKTAGRPRQTSAGKPHAAKADAEESGAGETVQTPAEMTAEARSDESFAPDGVYQPTPETADNGLPHLDTPEPLDESSEPEPGHPQPLPTLEQPAEDAAREETPIEFAQEPTGSDGGFAGEAELAEADASSEAELAEADVLVEAEPDVLAEAKPVTLVEAELDEPVGVAAIPVSSSEGKVYIGTVADVPPPPEPEEKISWFQRLKRGLSRSSKELSSSITGIFTKRKLDEDTLQELEDVLIRADLGMETALRITDTLSSGRFGKDVSDEEVRGVMRAEIEKVLAPVAKPLELDLSHRPHVILVVGVNGTGKTTTIGKLAAKLREAKLNVWLAAGDTFRAAAIEQLHIWGQRTGSPVVSNKIGSDAAGLAYDAFEKAKEAGADVLIIDTAGRLQNRTELMDELAKIVRVLGKLDPEAPHTVLQTLDATTGQNALNQVEIFRNIAGVNGLVMTKLDGTARGGILVGIAAKHKLPVYFIGVGEQVADLEPFSAKEFAAAIAGTET